MDANGKRWMMKAGVLAGAFLGMVLGAGTAVAGGGIYHSNLSSSTGHTLVVAQDSVTLGLRCDVCGTPLTKTDLVAVALNGKKTLADGTDLAQGGVAQQITATFLADLALNPKAEGVQTYPLVDGGWLDLEFKAEQEKDEQHLRLKMGWFDRSGARVAKAKISLETERTGNMKTKYELRMKGEGQSAGIGTSTKLVADSPEYVADGDFTVRDGIFGFWNVTFDAGFATDGVVAVRLNIVGASAEQPMVTAGIRPASQVAKNKEALALDSLRKATANLQESTKANIARATQAMVRKQPTKSGIQLLVTP